MTVPGFGNSDKRPAWGDTMMQVALAETCALQVASKLIQGEGRGTLGTKHPLVSLRAYCFFAARCEV